MRFRLGIILGDIVKRFSDLLELRRGSVKTELTRISDPGSGETGSIAFASGPEHLDNLRTGNPSAVVIPKSAELQMNDIPEGTSVVLSQNVKLAMALVAKEFFPHPLAKQTYGGEGVHPKAVVDPTARIGHRVTIGPHSVVGRNVIVGDDVFIGPNTVVEAGSTLGSGTYLHAQVYIAYDTHIGRYCEVLPQSSLGSEGFGYATDAKGQHHRITHYGRLILEDFVHIGSCVCIDRGTFKDSVIGAGTKIDNLCHLGHNITTGKNCFLTAGFISAGSATLGNNNFMGGRTSVAGHIVICDNVQAAGVSTIHKDVLKPGTYGGYPFIALKDFLKVQASLVHLPRMRRNLSQIMNKLGLTDESD